MCAQELNRVVRTQSKTERKTKIEIWTNYVNRNIDKIIKWTGTQFYKVPNFGRILFKANKNNGEHAIISNKAYNSLATGSDKIYQCEETAIELHREGISVKLYWNNSFKASAHKAAYKECPKHGLNCKFTAEKCAKGSQWPLYKPNNSK